jgi:hypothetical protein
MENNIEINLNQARSHNIEATSTNLVTPQVGQTFNVKRLDGEWFTAEVLETRVSDKEKTTEYFVHFENSKYIF